ncbi:hypothetical protein SAMN05421788_105358 [Filimonas lacunae]|uniref:Glycosyl hydrolase family 20, domain 2 n=1 Tax=Filimonas lacunae TaxID=477680 RepID=A0A173MCB0_9BACT|nr:hypothetical protein [Filimonas lacunae]BAV05185.1 hypothetical protein FLA_1192 [Filimonas lacunae]SIT22746.1 hypothetical protein SAMN05421788_105358 [Filimonas lacunae]
MSRFYNSLIVFFLYCLVSGFKPFPERVTVVIPQQSHVRIRFGAEKLVAALQKAGYQAEITSSAAFKKGQRYIIAGLQGDNILQKTTKGWPAAGDTAYGKEGFAIRSSGNTIAISGSAASGVLYGCMELADRIQAVGVLPAAIHVTDKPQMVLRGACVGLQKPYYLPGRTVYEYPYTPETFPWLYDKQLWISYLDSMVANRMNSLYLWNGHPFASLVKLKDYPYAVEVDEATFKKNEEIYRFLTTEADKRGIWVIQMFYNIIVSKPFAEYHHMKTQDRERPIIPVIADYTRKSIAAFVEKYPNVGLMVALGEAMEGVGNDDIEWFTKTIIPGVKDGLKLLGKTEEPPIVLRAHDTDAPEVMKAATPLYKNLYTEAKYNGEALTTYQPRGPWAELHRTLSKAAPVQIENVHILANLEPFRYGSADFIQKSVQAMHSVHNGNALHLYPESSYWDWPYAADSATPRLLQIERDWLWYKEWARYAWNCNRSREAEVAYWSGLLGGQFGANAAAGKSILTAYEEAGEIAPKLLRRFGITDGNRQTLTLGMFMNQLINPFRFGLFTLLYNSEGPEGEMLIEYAEKEWKQEKHMGETPVDIIQQVIAHGEKAVQAIDAAALAVSSNKAEFARIKNDMYCYRALANCFAEKAQAALWVLRYKYSKQLSDLDSALPHLEKSVVYYSTLADITKGAYRYANSMQTAQRKIPIGGDNGKNKTWVELLPFYQKELAVFKHNIDSLRHPVAVAAGAGKKPLLEAANVTVLSKTEGTYAFAVGQQMFSDTMSVIKNYAPELVSLTGLRFNKAQQMKEGTTITFTTEQPVQLLVGFFNKKGPGMLGEPELETNASANDYGQAETKIANGIVITGFPAVNVHSYSFKPGTHTLVLGKGAVMVLGFVKEGQLVKAYDAGLVPGVTKLELDWLFE